MVVYDVTSIIVALVSLLFAVVSAWLIPMLKANVGAQKWDQFMKMARVAVDAAEQLGLKDKALNKLAFAVEQVKLAMKAHNIVYNEDVVRTAIEAMVLPFNKSPISDSIVTLNGVAVQGLLESTEPASAAEAQEVKE